MDVMMDDRFQTIRELFSARDVKFAETTAGLQVGWNEAARLEILYPDDPSVPVMPVRLRIKDPDPGRRNATAAAARDFLETELAGLVTGVNDFRNSTENGPSCYDSRMDLDPEVVFFETILIGGKPAEAALKGSDADVSADPAPAAPQIAVLAGRAGDMDTAKAALAGLESIDSKMLRKSLDMMNLRRSSMIRLALTRIFRDAVDAPQLLSTIREEAEKIVSEEDRAELGLMRHLSTEFLKPVIQLLYKAVSDRG